MSAERQEPDKPSLSPELKATEALLAALRPAMPTLDRDRVMYEAGLAAARPTLASSEAMRWRPALRGAAQFAALAASLLVGVWFGDRRARDDGRPQPFAKRETIESPTSEQLAAAGEGAGAIVLPADSYGRLRKHLAAVDFDDSIRSSEPGRAAAEPNTWRDGRAELLRLLN